MRGRATFTTVASSTSISWATSTISTPMRARSAVSMREGAREKVTSESVLAQLVSSIDGPSYT